MISKSLRDKLFSQASLFQSNLNYPISHWKNKNRRKWTQEELELFWKEHLGEFELNMLKPQLLVKPFNQKEFSTLINHEKIKDKLHVGKVIKIGELAFDAICFPFGATCTYNDWIQFDLQSSEKVELNSQIFFLVEDRQVKGIVDDPKTIINNKEVSNE